MKGFEGLAEAIALVEEFDGYLKELGAEPDPPWTPRIDLATCAKKESVWKYVWVKYSACVPYARGARTQAIIDRYKEIQDG